MISQKNKKKPQTTELIHKHLAENASQTIIHKYEDTGEQLR